MIINTLTVIPPLLQEVRPLPARLFYRGAPLEELLSKPRIAIVGSRRPTPYGRQVTYTLAKELAEQGIVVISGLALGVDGIAHRSVVEAGGIAVAVLPTPLEQIVPAAHRSLARQIAEQGGTLVSEYAPGDHIGKQNFIARNRLVAGLADAVLITEATEKSGSLHTARFALEMGRDVLAVPGNINSPLSDGTNNLLKQGAYPVTGTEDVLHVLGISNPIRTSKAAGGTPDEQLILDLLDEGTTDGRQLLAGSKLDAGRFNKALTMLEITGKVRPTGANHWSR